MRLLRSNYQLSGLILLGGFLLTCYSAVGRAVGSSRAPSTQAAPADTTAGRVGHGGFTAALSYSSNSSFFGRSQTTRYPYMAGELTYKSRFGVWGSVMSYDLFDTSSLVDETDLSMGWDGDLSRTVDASLSYSRFLFAANSPLIKSSVNNSVDAYVGWDWQYVYSRLNASYLFGERSDVFLTLDNSRNFEINRVFTPDGYLSIVPRLSLTAGTQRFIETSMEQQTRRGNGKTKTSNGNGNGNGNGHGNGNGNGNGSGTSTGSTIVTTTSSTRFQILTYELRLPVTYSLGVISAQVAWRYFIPVNLLPDDDSRPRSFFTTSLSLNL
ncbi:hypothetical protein IC235_16740 [Hymenobacter sp. BT664]|uniref:Uncharacterized protein n=1 Tax=Hymenobacter montanus TaxID=2771359 RepID=A0A927BEU7_9BACT|nr:hypothetical protein [Hymenobacter montanus]MBD2769537.1 hypothetical protein [Hymenobacter montanus]